MTARHRTVNSERLFSVCERVVLLHPDNYTAGPTLSLAGILSTSAVEQFDPAARFKCWTVGDALHASRHVTRKAKTYAEQQTGVRPAH